MCTGTSVTDTISRLLHRLCHTRAHAHSERHAERGEEQRARDQRLDGTEEASNFDGRRNLLRYLRSRKRAPVPSPFHSEHYGRAYRPGRNLYC